MVELSKTNKRMLAAIADGYHVINGEVFSPYRNKPLKASPDDRGYRSFTYQKKPVYVHRVVAFQKYGYKMFDPELEVRHLDNNKLNNVDDNIVLGTHTDNMRDCLEDVRVNKSIKASTRLRKFSDEEMEEIRACRKEGSTYSELMSQFNISSKGSLHYILNTKYVTKK